MHNKKTQKKIASLLSTLEFFVFHKQGTIEDVASYINKDYTTALRLIRRLEDMDLLKIERFEKTKVKGKERKIYQITLHGLFTFANCCKELVDSKFEEMAEAHSDKLITFKKWKYFKERKLSETIKKRFFDSLKTYKVAIYLFSIVARAEHGSLFLPKFQTGKNTAKAADMDILGFTYITMPPEYVKQVLGEQKWNEFVKLFKALAEDYELRMFRDETLFTMRNQFTEAGKALEQWKSILQ